MKTRDLLGVIAFAGAMTAAASARADPPIAMDFGVEVGVGVAHVNARGTGAATGLPSAALTGPIFRSGVVVDLSIAPCGCLALGFSTGVIGSAYTFEGRDVIEDVAFDTTFVRRTLSVPLLLSLVLPRAGVWRGRLDVGAEVAIPAGAWGRAFEPTTGETLYLEGLELVRGAAVARFILEIWPTRDLGLLVGGRGAYSPHGVGDDVARVDADRHVDLDAELELTGSLSVVHRFIGP